MVHRGAWNLETITAAFNAAALDPARWPTALEVITRETGSHGAVLIPVTGVIPNQLFTPSLAALNERYFAESWYTRDLRFRGIPLLRRRGSFSEPHYTTAEEIRQHEYFQDLLNSFGLRWSAAVRMMAGSDMWAVTLQRTIEQGPYAPPELELLEALSSRLSAAGALTAALGFARADAAAHALELSDTAIVLLDRRGDVLKVNAAAERLFGPDVSVTGGRLCSASSSATVGLEKALKEVLWHTALPSVPHAPILLPRAGRLPFLAYPLRIREVSIDPLAPCQAAVVLHDPEYRAPPEPVAFRLVYGLTLAETRICLLLCEGLTIAQASERLGISTITGRNQVGASMQKVGVHRQADLIAALGRLSPPSMTVRP